MRIRTFGATAAAMLAGSVLVACSSSTSTPATSSAAAAGTSAASAPAATGEVQTLVLGAVPSLDLGVIDVAKQQGYLADAGIDVSIVPVDSGPNVVTGIVAGQYDIGSTAYAPPLLAVGEGAPLKVVLNSGAIGPDGTNSGLVVRSDSGITSWKDLAGKKIASNAPRSLLSLTVPAAIAADGGDPSGIEIVPLPFNQIGKAVNDGQVDAGVELDPFLTGALAEYPDLKNLGDSIFEALPAGTPSGLFFTSNDTATNKATAIAGFKDALTKAYDYANAHPDEVKAAGAALAGLTPEQAAKQPTTDFSAALTADQLTPLVDLMVKFGWLKSAPDLSSFVGQ